MASKTNTTRYSYLAVKDTSLSSTIRSQWRVPKTLHRLMIAICKKHDSSLNDLINLAVLEYVKHLALADQLGYIEGTDEAYTTAVSIGLLARVENAEHSIRELRELGESGEIPTEEQFTFLRHNLSPELHHALMKDIDVNGPLIYRGPDDPDKKPYFRAKPEVRKTRIVEAEVETASIQETVPADGTLESSSSGEVETGRSELDSEPEDEDLVETLIDAKLRDLAEIERIEKGANSK